MQKREWVYLMKKTFAMIGIGVVLASGIAAYGLQDEPYDDGACLEVHEQAEQNHNLDDLDTVKVASINTDHDEPTSQNGEAEQGDVGGLHLDAAESESDPEPCSEADPILNLKKGWGSS